MEVRGCVGSERLTKGIATESATNGTNATSTEAMRRCMRALQGRCGVILAANFPQIDSRFRHLDRHVAHRLDQDL